MSANKLSLTILATQLVEAVVKDETPEAGGCDISAGMLGPNLSAWLRDLERTYENLQYARQQDLKTMWACLTSAEAQLEALRKEAEWQPIETAPKDGKRILIRDSDGQRQVAGFCRVLGCDFYAWVIANDMHITADMATHWKPLPTPPKMGEKA